MAPIAIKSQVSSVAPFVRADEVLIPQRQHRLVSWVILLTIATNLLVIVAIWKYAQLHEYIQWSDRLYASFILIGNGLNVYFKPLKIACYTAIACHILSLLFMIYARVPRRFQPWRALNTSAILKPRHHRLITSLIRWYGHAKAFVSLHSTEIVQLRVLFEVMQQVFQAGKMSRLIVAVWLNTLMVVVVVLNCWLLPLAHWMARESEDSSRRVVRLLVDTALDVVYSIGIPAVILLRYASIYDTTEQSFPLYYYAMDAWGEVAAAELRQVFVTSWIDLVSKVSPWFFLCYRLHSLRHLLSAVGTQRPVKPSRSRLSFLLNVTLVVVGLTVLLVYLQAQWLAANSSVRGCIVELRPWFAKSYTCSVVELSCSQRGITGLATEIDAAIGEIDASYVHGLVISHCTQLVMPPSIRNFTFLVMLKLYNSSVVTWDKTSELTASTTPYLQQFIAIETNFTKFPAGLEATDMPPALIDVKLIGTNLAELPLSLALAWSRIQFLTIELSPNLHVAPPVLKLFPLLVMLSLGSNDLTTTSTLEFDVGRIVALGFTNNPRLSSLPDSLGRDIYRLSIQKTNVSAIPEAWTASTDTRYQRLPSIVNVYAASTPLCEDLLRSHDPFQPAVFPRGRLLISCDDQAAIAPDVSYPLDLERSWRAVNRV